ncbi:uncharacterized protein EI90DRAFT_3041303 [Cantharellus anzutake]|uniref:uncharacterized protein n=1 Tax=Cantharellus anzutake TaxID=1750568 RepID=UPI0019037DAE|nr:uncharacterized protein EI90DRAFT_3041303 [Cantharellus anzutake]KAF8338012.1 hypothetical protein EI90DRAFT_3041303 [Cantharellus anzutake]
MPSLVLHPIHPIPPILFPLFLFVLVPTIDDRAVVFARTRKNVGLVQAFSSMIPRQCLACMCPLDEEALKKQTGSELLMTNGTQSRMNDATPTRRESSWYAPVARMQQEKI